MSLKYLDIPFAELSDQMADLIKGDLYCSVLMLKPCNKKNVSLMILS
jgi:hypothetical protein